MTRDKQLRGINLQTVRLKRDLDQALNAKQFAVLAGISYSVAREWFHLPGFPAVRGMVFWADFVIWRRKQNPLKLPQIPSPVENGKLVRAEVTSAKSVSQWPARATSILAEAV